VSIGGKRQQTRQTKRQGKMSHLPKEVRVVWGRELMRRRELDAGVS